MLETERLVLRRFTPEDADDTYLIYTDPENMRFMGRRPDSVEFERYHIRKHIADYYDKHGFGLWAVVLKEDGRLIGRCGLLYQQVGGAREVEVTYLIDRRHWGRGLATEAAREAVRLGFEHYKFPRIVALINPENVASVRVAQKIGMKYERDVGFKEFGEVAMYVLKLVDNYPIRRLTPSDQPFLREMLYQSLYVREGVEPFPREVLGRPEISKYVEGWGRAGDLGFVAVERGSGEPVGAAWLRLLAGDEKGYGYVDDETPELGMAVLPAHRGRGVGSGLLQRLLESAAHDYRKVCLSVSPDNPALRLYERVGFERAGGGGSSVTMVKRLRD